MTLLASLLVGKPLNVLAVALLFFIGHLLLRLTALGQGRRARPLLVAAGIWALYAAWEWLVQVRTPEANIRVDLMLIWPVVAIASIAAVVQALRRPRRA
jgi:hypothetical protein